MARFKKDLVEISRQHREDEIQFVNFQLIDCTEQIERLQTMMVSCEKPRERYSLEEKLALELKKKALLTEKLARLRRKVEKRGRPKKAEGQGYQEQRQKFTAWLKPENLAYVKELKTGKGIANISAFLDHLIEQHRKHG